MDRLACLDIPGFAIQLLARAHPDWRGQPVAVVAEDRPSAVIVAVNARARRAGVLPGQRYATGLALARHLRAGVVAPAAIDREISALTGRLRRFSPDIEPAPGLPGVFWINADGLSRLFPSLDSWSAAIAADLAAARFRAALVTGFTRFGTYAAAKVSRSIQVFETADAEREAARRVPLAMLDLDPDVRDFLASLGILTVGDFLTLPPAATRVRLGEAAFRLHQLASGDLWRPLVPAAADPIFTRQVDLDAPIGDVDRLVFLAKPLVDGLVADLASRSLAAVRLTCRLTLDNRRSQDVAIAPAAPTIDAVQLVTLLRLRLSATALSARVTALEIGVAPTAALPATLRLFAAHSRRDLSAAARAFARLRALLGEDAIVRARLVEAHLPRARVAWEAVDRLPDRAPAPRGTAPRRLVRRLLAASERLSTTVETGARDWLRGEIDDGRVSAMAGPYVVSGAWWRGGVHREYFFLRSSTGAIRWVYFDRAARAWFLEGRVE